MGKLSILSFVSFIPSSLCILGGCSCPGSVYCLGLVFLLCCEAVRREGEVFLSLVTLVVEGCSVTL